MDWKMKMRSPSSSSSSSDQNCLEPEAISNLESWDDVPLVSSPDSSGSPELSASSDEFNAENLDDQVDNSERRKMIKIKNEVKNDHHCTDGDHENATASGNDNNQLNDEVRALKKRLYEDLSEGDESKSKKAEYDKHEKYCTAVREEIGSLQNQIGSIDLGDSPPGPPGPPRSMMKDLDLAGDDESDDEPDSKSKKLKLAGFLKHEDHIDRELFKLMLDYYEKEGTYPAQRGHHIVNFTVRCIPPNLMNLNLVQRKVSCLMIKYSQIALRQRRNPGIPLSVEDQAKLNMYLTWKKNPCF